MKRLFTMLFLVFVIAIILVGVYICLFSTSPLIGGPTPKTSGVTNETSDNLTYTIEESEYYKITQTNNMYSYTIYGKDKRIVKNIEQINGQPRIIMVEDNVIQISIQAGTGIATQSTYFYHIENDVFSESFTAVFDYYDGVIIYALYNKIVVRSVFDEKVYKEFTDFSAPFSPVAFPFENIVFTNDGHSIEVTYLSGNDYTKVAEVFVIDEFGND